MVERFETFEDATKGSLAPKEILETLTLIDVPYVSFTGTDETGQLVIHKDLAREVQEIFEELYALSFPIYKIVPQVFYNWNDMVSMTDNNTSSFNYRTIIGKDTLSNHSLGRAIDINPMQNPYFAVDGKSYPAEGIYSVDQKGTLLANSLPVLSFKKRGWRWLGDRESNTDYQHFDKA